MPRLPGTPTGCSSTSSPPSRSGYCGRSCTRRPGGRAGRTSPTPAAWLPAAVDHEPETLARILGSIAGYPTVPGYRDMFTAAGFGAAVERAASGADAEVLPEAAGVVGPVRPERTLAALTSA
ncbi:hypothetical protein [Streptomyces sp. NPDC003635]